MLPRSYPLLNQKSSDLSIGHSSLCIRIGAISERWLGEWLVFMRGKCEKEAETLFTQPLTYFNLAYYKTNQPHFRSSAQ